MPREDGSFTEVEKQMLNNPFYIDGWHNRDYLETADKLVEMGLIRRHEGGDSQYTSYHYEPIE